MNRKLEKEAHHEFCEEIYTAIKGIEHDIYDVEEVKDMLKTLKEAGDQVSYTQLEKLLLKTLEKN